MRIAHVTATFPPYYGGTGNVCYYNARELARRGHEVHVFTTNVDGAPNNECLENVKVHRLRPLLQFGNAPLLPKLFLLSGFDIIHLHHPFIFGAEMIRIVSALRRIPYVLTHHNDLIGIGHRRWLFNLYSMFFSQSVFAGACCLITVSKDYSNHSRLRTLFKRHSNVYEVPNGIDPEIFHPLPASTQIRDLFKIPYKIPLGTFVAALDRAHHFKGLDVLFHALTIPKLEGIHLLVIGDGDLKKYYQDLSNKLMIGKRVYFAGKIAHSKLPTYLSAGDFLVLPTKPPESFGMVLVEAMACGTPVITSDIPGVRRIVDNGVDGFLVKPGNIPCLVEKIDHMQSLSNEERQAMGKSGRKKVLTNYTWEIAGERLESIYQEILTNGGNR